MFYIFGETVQAVEHSVDEQILARGRDSRSRLFSWGMTPISRLIAEGRDASRPAIVKPPESGLESRVSIFIERSLSRPVGAEEAEDLPRLHREAHTVHGRHCPVGFVRSLISIMAA